MSRLYVSADSDTVKTLRTARGYHRVSAHPRGWNTGARATVTGAGDKPVAVYVERTSGSSENDAPSDIATWHEGGPTRLIVRPGDRVILCGFSGLDPRGWSEWEIEPASTDDGFPTLRPVPPTA